MLNLAQWNSVNVAIDCMHSKRHRRPGGFILMQDSAVLDNLIRQQRRRFIENDNVNVVSAKDVAAIANEIDLGAEALIGWHVRPEQNR